MSDESPEGIKARIDRLAEQVSNLRAAIEGKPELGWTGLGQRVATLESDTRDLKKVQDDFVRDAQREREQKTKDEGRRNLIVTAALSALGAIVTGIVLMILTNTVGGP